jgi:hypothetical protein
MNPNYRAFDAYKQQDRRDLFEATAVKLGTNAQSVEKDFWVCRTIDALFKGLPRQPKLFFKGGTSLSKGFGLIRRFSEDIDIVLSRNGLLLGPDRDPFIEGLSAKKRKERFEALAEICAQHVGDKMKTRLATLMPSCVVQVSDKDPMALELRYPSLFPQDAYLRPFVKVECGARGALEPIEVRTIAPYVQDLLEMQLDLTTPKVTLIAARRTFWEKALILHGIYCGYRDEGRTPDDANPISRHYYDLAMMQGAKQGKAAVKDLALLADVREHKILAFKRSWEKLEEATPGQVRLVPQAEIQSLLEADFARMTGMMFGDPPSFSWVLERIAALEVDINRAAL